MCEIHRYTTVHSDGSREKTWSSRLCPVGERHRKPCNSTKEFKHPVNERYTGANVTSHYTTPPSPPSSDSSFPLSGGEGEGRKKRSSGIYVNGNKVMDVGRKPSRREKRHSDHIIIVDPPVEPSSPPRRPHLTPILKPSSPPRHFTSAASQYPTHTRPEVRIEVGGSGVSSGHRRQSSHSSQHSRDSVSDEERRVRKLKRELEKAEDVLRRQRMQSEISRANEAIASRPAVPSAPNPLAATTSTAAATVGSAPSYRRPSVSVRRPDQELTDAMRQLRVTEQTMADAERERKRHQVRRAEERRQALEDEAQKQRLRDRMTPASQRRPTKIVFPDGTYRYEF